MRLEQDILSVLSVDCPVDGRDESVNVTHVSTARSALAALRMTHFDLMLTQTAVAGEPIWELAAKVRAVRPKLQWMLLMDDEAGFATELRARSFGMAPFHGQIAGPDEILNRVRRTLVPVRQVTPSISLRPDVTSNTLHRVG